MRLRRFALLTLVAHAVFGVGIATHARLAGRDAGRWPYATLVLGVFGIAGYALGNRR